MTFSNKDIVVSEMTSSIVANDSFLNKDVNSTTMTSQRLMIEEYVNYFNLLDYTFIDEEKAFWMLSDGKYWGQNEIAVSENIQGYVIQGDLRWDDEDDRGMITMYHQTQTAGYISDIYDPSHAIWSGCGHEWDIATEDSIEEIHRIAVDAYFDSFYPYFSDVNLYFGDWYRASNHSPVDITEDFSKLNVPEAFFEEKTPIIVSGWTERGI